MKLVYPYAAALDIGKKKTVARIHTPRHQQTRTFAMMTRDLLEMADWLLEHGVTHVAMEATGAYWKPIFNVLEGYDLELLLAGPHEVKAVPGRKTDVTDAEWLADLLRHGLLRPSFVPGRAQRELRELIRYRRRTVQERARAYNRLEKVLEGANIKLSSVASTITGTSVRQMLRALIEGEQDLDQIAELAKGPLRRKRAELVEALRGTVGAHQRFMLREVLGHIEETSARLERLSAEIAERLRPFEEVLQRLETIPGWGRRTAEEVIAEIGTDMSRFPSAKHLASWAKVCPSNNESAGKRKSGSTGQGNRYVRSTLIEAAQSAGRTKGTYLSAQYRRLASRRGAKRAAMAVGHSMLVVAYCILREGTTYQDLGANYFDERKEEHVVRHMQRRLERLGYAVTITKQAA